MGCSASSTIHLLDKSETSALIEQLIANTMVSSSNTVDHQTLLAFQAFLMQQNFTPSTCQAAIDYFESLLRSENGYALFDVSVRILIEVGRLWYLKHETLIFFQHLKNTSTSSFDNLVLTLADYCDPHKRNLFLSAHHIDVVVRILNQKNNLPPTTLSLFTYYLTHQQPDIHSIIQTLRTKYLPVIIIQASDANLVHHNLKHAAEIKVRAIYALNELNAFQKKTANCTTPHSPLTTEQLNFLRVIASFVIECHDHEQKIIGDYASVEQATAARVSGWLTAALPNIPPAISDMITLINDYIIVLGTTMIFSHTSTMDLIELYSLLENATNTPGQHNQTPNDGLFRLFKCIALVSGICDKTPASILSIVKMQTDNIQTCSLKHLELYGASSIRIFLEQKKYPFQLYFESMPTKYSYQAFLIALVPHICMRAELAKSKAFRLFITYCQNLHTLHYEPALFVGALNEQFSERNVFNEVMNFFFSRNKIEQEIAFCKSQINSLEFARQSLIDDNYLTGEHNSFITTSMPSTDARNLNALSAYFQELSPAQQITLVKDLTLNIILQAGAIYLEQPQIYTQISGENTNQQGSSIKNSTLQTPSHRRSNPLTASTGQTFFRELEDENTTRDKSTTVASFRRISSS